MTTAAEAAKAAKAAAAEAAEAAVAAAEARLLERAATGDEVAGLLAAALRYHDRERKPFWWAHFHRLSGDWMDHADGRDVFTVETVEADGGWQEPTSGQKRRRRELIVRGRWGEGSVPGRLKDIAPVYDPPLPHWLEAPEGGTRATGGAARLDGRAPTFGSDDRVTVVLTGPAEEVLTDEVPLALVPASPPDTDPLTNALLALALQVLDDGLVDQPGLALLRRDPLSPEATAARPALEAVLGLLRAGPHPCVAVQGPPGTGKTYLGAHVVAALARQGWRIGVVAQSHTVISHFLDGVVAAGLPVADVGMKQRPDQGSSTALQNAQVAAFLARPGVVLGGTVWQFCKTAEVTPGSLDLLVVDEAGQYSLADTLAASTAARRLLLLGDPQQLPQVSQGTHPAPVDTAGLGWLMRGRATMPPEHGLFLDGTYRLHPTLCTPVSHLAYDGRLAALPAAAERHLEGVAPGLHPVPVVHEGNATSSPEEADQVVAVVQDLLGRAWSDAGVRRALEARDVLVVAAYNAQVARIQRSLTAVGLGEVQVGTVDRFQGRQAAVAVVSLAASSAAEVPRGLDFLLSRHRLNVAISRAQWATYLVHSPALADHWPSTVEGLLQLGAFLRLIQPRPPARAEGSAP